MNAGSKYDLVLMDIIMPNLDGVSATHLVRQFDNTTPIIAMTSNIRSDDISMYFQHGKSRSLSFSIIYCTNFPFRHERRSSQTLHQGGSPQHARKASSAPQKAQRRRSRCYATTSRLGEAQSQIRRLTGHISRDEFELELSKPTRHRFTRRQSHHRRVLHANESVRPTRPRRTSHVHECSGANSDERKRAGWYAGYAEERNW
jgi:CheY-like chemotaxis protein